MASSYPSYVYRHRFVCVFPRGQGRGEEGYKVEMKRIVEGDLGGTLLVLVLLYGGVSCRLISFVFRMCVSLCLVYHGPLKWGQ